jgi:teichuronic acid biosynthesis glycosyltransferase TuaC
MKILFIASSRKGKGLSPFIQSQKESIEKHGVIIDLFLISGEGIKNYFKAIFLIRAKYKTNEYDLIHAHYGFCGIAAKIALTKSPVIISFMGDDLLGTPNYKGQYKFKNSLFAFTNILFSWFYDSIIVKSAEMRDKLPRRKNIHIIPNGVDFNCFYPVKQQIVRSELNLSLTKVYLLFAGSPKFPRKNYVLAKTVMELLEENNLELLVIENIPYEKVFLYYNAINVLLLLSLHEGSPNVIKEAMACNCPIVSVDVGDVKEVIGKTEGCFICSYKPEDVAEKINQAIRFGRRTNGREMIGHLKSEIIAAKVVQVYENILKK